MKYVYIFMKYTYMLKYFILFVKYKQNSCKNVIVCIIVFIINHMQRIKDNDEVQDN